MATVDKEQENETVPMPHVEQITAQEEPDTERESLLTLSTFGTDREDANLLDPTYEPKVSSRGFVFAFVLFPAIFGLAFYALKSKSAAPHHSMTKQAGHAVVAPTVLISIDGFRHDYISRRKKGVGKGGSVMPFLAPTLNKLVQTGAVAKEGMQPVMPSITFPNHWSIVTGLYPESHGIVGNTMYSPITKTWFHHSGTDPHWWFGEPIWQTLQHASLQFVDENGTRQASTGNYTTACVFWPGSTVAKHAPDAFWEFNRDISYRKRVDRAVDLVTGEAKDLDRPAQFVTLYFDHVDHNGHMYGPDSDEVNAAIAEVDKAIERLVSRLDAAVPDGYNIVVVSDHGMTSITTDRIVDLTDAIPPGSVQDIVTSPLGLWLNVTAPVETVYNEILAKTQKSDGHAQVFKKEDLPVRWHISKSPYISDVVTMAKLQWTVTYPHQELVQGADKPYIKPGSTQPANVKDFTDKGAHGYDNVEADMQAMFVANGPAFKEGVMFEGMRVIDVYPMLCHIFGAEPSPNNGSLAVTLNTILKSR